MSSDAAVHRILDEVAAAGVQVLHGRRLPKLRATIDHIAVAPTGVYVIATRSAEGSIAVLRRSFSRKYDLYVGKENRTAWVSALAKPVDAVRRALEGDPIPVLPTVATVRVQWPLVQRSFTIDGVTVVSWPTLRKRLEQARTAPTGDHRTPRPHAALCTPPGVKVLPPAGAAATSV